MGNPSGPREEFLSEEDLDLRNLSDDEFDAWWRLWFRLAQATNDLDEATYSHGVFDRDPAVTSRASDHFFDGGTGAGGSTNTSDA